MSRPDPDAPQRPVVIAVTRHIDLDKDGNEQVRDGHTIAALDDEEETA